MSGARPGTGTAARLEDAARTASRLTLRVLYGGTALLGALLTPPERMLLGAPAVGLGALLATAAGCWWCRRLGPSRQLPWSAAVVAAAAVPFSHAVDALGDTGAAVVFAVLTLLAVTVSDWITSGSEPAGAATTGSARVREGRQDDPESLAVLLRGLPMALLCQEWHATTPHRDAGALGPRAARDRTLLLEEMTRRDPAGVRRWLRAGPGAAPELYLQDGHAAEDRPAGRDDAGAVRPLGRRRRGRR